MVGLDSTHRYALPKSGYEREFSWDPWGSIGVTHDNCYDYAFGSFSDNRTVKSVPGAAAKLSSNKLTFRNCNGIVKLVLADNPKRVYRMKNPNSRPRPGFYKVMCFVAPTNDFGDSFGDFHWYAQMGSVRYRTVIGDTVEKVAKLFHVKPAVVLAAAKRSTPPKSNSDGKIATANTNVKRPVSLVRGTPLTPGRIIRFPVNLWSHKQGHASGPLMIDASGKTIVDPRRSDRKWKPGFHYTKFCAAYGVMRGAVRTGNLANGNTVRNVNTPRRATGTINKPNSRPAGNSNRRKNIA